jgi:hypothetical protein
VLREAEAESQGETDGGQDSNWPQNNDDDDDVTPGRNLAGTWQLFFYIREKTCDMIWLALSAPLPSIY